MTDNPKLDLTSATHPPELPPAADDLLRVDLPHNPDLQKQKVQRKIGKNVSVTILVQIANMASRLLTVSFMLSHLGTEMYGTWQIIFIPVNMMGTTTMGVSFVYVKYVAEYTARREYDRANALLSTGITFTLPLCIGMFTAMYFLWDWLALKMHVPAGSGPEIREAALIVFAIFLSSIGLSAYTDVLNGVQEIAAAQWIQLIAYVTEIILIFTLVALGRGIRGMAEAYLAGNSLALLLSIVWCYRNLKWFRISPRLFSLRELKEVFGFGLVVQIQSVFDIVLFNIDRIIGAFFIGPLAVAPIDLAKKMPAALVSIPQSFNSAFIPAASQLQAEHDAKVALHGHDPNAENPVAWLYLSGSRYTNMVSGYFFALMAMLPVPIFTVWLGHPIAYVVPLFVLFNLAMQMHTLTGPGTSILRGAGRAREEFFYAIPNALCLCLFVPLSHVLLHEWNVLGIGAAVCLSTLCSSLIFLTRIHHVLRVPFLAYLRDVIWPGTVPYFVAAIFLYPTTRLAAQLNRTEGIALLFLTGLLYTLILATVLYTTLLSQNERGRWRSLLKRFRNTSRPVV